LHFHQHDVIADFGSQTGEPGAMSAAAIDVLADELDTRRTTRDGPWRWGDEWADRVAAVADAGLPALLERLDHPSPGVRRALAFVLSYVESPELPGALRAHIEVEPDTATMIGLLVALGRYPDERPYLRERTGTAYTAEMRFGAAFGLLMRPCPPYGDGPAAGPQLDDDAIEALTLCVSENVESRLQDLPWMDPEWDSVVSVVGDRLRHRPEALARWRTRMLTMISTGECPGLWSAVCCQHAAELGDDHPELAAPLGPLIGDLLRHPRTAVRRGALQSVDHWLGTADDAVPLDRVAAALDTPGLSDLALGVLVRHGDPRCVPPLREMLAGPLDHTTQNLLRGAAPFADALMPDLRARLSTDPAPHDALLLLEGISSWPGLHAVLPELRHMRYSLRRRAQEWRAGLALDRLRTILSDITPEETKHLADQDPTNKDRTDRDRTDKYLADQDLADQDLADEDLTTAEDA
jgi:HEAT repeat protein